TGANAIAGEWGHNPLPLPLPNDQPLPQCYCGRRGCIETYLSGPAFSADHARRTGVSLAANEIAMRAEEGDTQCKASLERYEERLARSLAGVINILDPDVIVLGGGLSRIDRLYRNVPKRWVDTVFFDELRPRLGARDSRAASGVRGAAW